MKNIHPADTMPYTRLEIHDYMREKLTYDNGNPYWEDWVKAALIKILENDLGESKIKQDQHTNLGQYGFRNRESTYFIKACVIAKACRIVGWNTMKHTSKILRKNYVIQLSIYSNREKLRRGLIKFYGVR